MEHFGCESLLDFCEQEKAPLLVVSGHLHEGGGTVTTNTRTVFCNASTLNVHYNVSAPNPPVVLDMPRPVRAQNSSAEKYE